jgi:class 3 adenylate cyclase
VQDEAVPRTWGVLTFVFTDIVGSTRLWEERPTAMATALERHDAIVRWVLESRGEVAASPAA